MLPLRSGTVLSALLTLLGTAFAAETTPPGPDQRPLRYTAQDEAFVIRNGNEVFNRPLYAGNAGFRVDAGDRPRLALFKPGRAGAVRLAAARAEGGEPRWLDQAADITARYRDGAMSWDVVDPALGEARLRLMAVPVAPADGAGAGLALQVEVISGGPVRLWWATAPGDGNRGRRNGDMGGEKVPLAVFHDARPVEGAAIRIVNDRFQVAGPVGLVGGLPAGSTAGLADVGAWSSAAGLIGTLGSSVTRPVAVVTATVEPGRPFHAILRLAEASGEPTQAALAPTVFTAALAACRQRAGRMAIVTPDPLLNAAVPALCIAADAIWDEPTRTYQHGACGWRVPLLGWRGIYAGDAYGWHDRTADHLAFYAARQNTAAVPATLPAPDPKHRLARSEPALATNGNLSQNLMHYDMNLVAVDAWFRHLLWTGDLTEAQRMWPVLERHMAWERRLFRRTFGATNLPLYEAYACIWASDELIYSGGGVTHASAYNLFHLRMMARLASRLGRDPAPWTAEADLLERGLREHLWLADRGSFAEYKDLLGRQAVHPEAGVWTAYHTVDSRIVDTRDAWQVVQAMATGLPRIPLTGRGVPAGRYVQSTTTWMPYVWSVNNVALAESVHAALASWQAGRSDLAMDLLQGALTDHMQLGRCPGNVGMTSATDVAAKETYRDFADSAGIAGRAVVEGLFGIMPDALAGEVVVRPGLPPAWDHASLTHPSFAVRYHRDGELETYELVPSMSVPVRLRLQAEARGDQVAEVLIDGVPAPWTVVPDAVGSPRIEITAPAGSRPCITIRWAGGRPVATPMEQPGALDGPVEVRLAPASIVTTADPQGILVQARAEGSTLRARLTGLAGHRTAFVQVAQGALRWWVPLTWETRPAVEALPVAEQVADRLRVRLRHQQTAPLEVSLTVASSAPVTRTIAPGPLGEVVELPVTGLRPGTQVVRVAVAGQTVAQALVPHWRLKADGQTWDTLDLTAAMQAQVERIFDQRYLAPRSPFCSLALPWQGIGGWCHYEVTATIDASGLRRVAASNGGLLPTPFGVPFRIADGKAPSDIVLTSRWENTPAEVVIPLSGTAQHAYLLMTGTTNPMQCRMDNGVVEVTYADGGSARLALHAPTTWWPIDQDYRVNGLAFRRPEPVPPRVRLATGAVEVRDPADLIGAGPIAGGGAIILDLPLEAGRPLRSLTLRAECNDVLVGLMAATLVR